MFNFGEEISKFTANLFVELKHLLTSILNFRKGYRMRTFCKNLQLIYSRTEYSSYSYEMTCNEYMRWGSFTSRALPSLIFTVFILIILFVDQQSLILLNNFFFL